MPGYRLRGAIPSELQAKPGKALCYYRDAGWGGLVYQGKYQSGRFSEELVTACAAMVRTWNPRPSPNWVTCIPSRRHPELVPDLAQRLAAALSLPFHAVLEQTRERPEQKTMENPAMQAQNVDDSMTIRARKVPSGPVLLVDDMVGSRWTLSVAAWLLRSHGSGDVFPLALSLTGQER